MQVGIGLGGLGLQTTQALLDSADGVAEIHGIVGEDNLSGSRSKSADSNDLCRCGPGVDAYDDILTALVHGIDGGGIALLGLQPCRMLCLGSEKWGQLLFHLTHMGTGGTGGGSRISTVAYPLLYLRERHRLGLSATDGTA